jgi:hypothetical protein
VRLIIKRRKDDDIFFDYFLLFSDFFSQLTKIILITLMDKWLFSGNLKKKEKHQT